MNKKVYIVLLNYNNSEDSIECLESILKLHYTNYQIIIIDNSETLQYFKELQLWAEGQSLSFLSIDEKYFLLESKKEKILFVKAEENKGFAAGNNLALQYILNQKEQDSYIWLLNNDTVLEKNSLTDIVSQIDKQDISNSKIIYGTALLEYDNPAKVQALGGLYHPKTGLTSHLGEGISINEAILNFDKIVEKASYPIGASMIIKYTDLESIGLLSEDYFLFYEELDWISRAKQNGGSLKILPVFGIYHKQGNSTKSKINEQKSEFIDLVSMNSRITFAKKYNRKNLGFIYLSILTLTIGNRIWQRNFKIIPKILKMVFSKSKKLKQSNEN
ncbi:glycosyltransferase [Flavobacterium soyae]|uniref:glycosyltransferase n=1 Tax=Flavobacterium soyae TaxID=2903098 RepID=UPI001E502C9B|nr:glycosyltransferase family 2 protein [Flavobacterium soyae]MCD9574713.1 glycosyltransferase family 2 protein [Flavobacterium soyae]